ncbi:Hsp70 family protein [Actinacidiphila alni]|uniref:Hsp70 family protein n=1 Tax=Actinacidiphila alni TaxID=380248 RepID=UPI0033FF734F
MSRETVDFGIDLGTTNSAVARSTGADAEIVRNNLRFEYTPSAVYIGRSGTVQVGQRARARLETDPADARAEFKLQMGVRDRTYEFAAGGLSLTPEQLSAEVLKSLRQDVRAAYGEEVAAAVITVPAAFELDQCDATRRAAALAGLDFAPLLQEPTAAAWAYSATATDVPRRGFWLVYDLGGGTFDAAVIQVEDGEFTVVNHAGDNHLGGKNIDWRIVDDLLVPAARELPGLAGLDRRDLRQSANTARLKQAAEETKIELSQAPWAEIDLDLEDAEGRRVPFTHRVERAELERIALPLYRDSVELCRRALAEKGLATGDIERVLLVGGATLAPALRELLADPVEGLGIRLDHSLDPVTVVARGAAIFARTQRVPHDVKHRGAQVGSVLLDFANKPTGRAEDPLVGGQARVADPVDGGGGGAGAGSGAGSGTGDRDWTGWTIEFVDAVDGMPEWRSGHVPLDPGGSFATRLNARAATNTYAIELRTPQGSLVPTSPDSTSYQRMDFEGGDATLSHSLGIWVEGNDVAWILRKGTELPASGRLVLESTVDVRRGQRTGLIKVPVVQGERPRADRNSVIGELEIRPDAIARDVPIGSEVEVYVSIDQSFTVRVEVFIPILDEEYEIDVDLGRDTPDVDALRKQSRAVARQYEKLRTRAVTTEADRTTALLDEFDQGGGLGGIDRELESAPATPDGPAVVQELLRKAETALDEAEDALELPQLVQSADGVRTWVREVVEEHGDAGTGRELAVVERELDEAIASGDPTLVTHRTEVVRNLGLRVLDASGQLPVLRFMSLKETFATSNEPRVLRLLTDGEDALAAHDIDRLRSVVIDLGRLVPSDAIAPDGSLTTTVRQQR